ncbi:MAG: hypothetical protein HY781_03215 [Chloroflexi bacterium]|nr:hypothetical protein [Chloroflexota bacterium]
MRSRLTLLHGIVAILMLLSACGGQPPPTADFIIFTAERTSIQAGECTILHWEVTDGFGVTLNAQPVDKAGQMEVCPTETRGYELAVDMGTHIETRGVEITVSGEGQAGGPTPLPSGMPESEPGIWVRLGGPPGGLGYDIRYNFGNPNIWYVTDTGAGVHISTDNGLTWTPSNNGIPSATLNDYPPIFSLTVDPINPQILWAGTLDTGHIYKSTDGGQSWEQRDNGIGAGIEYQILSFRGFTVDPRASDIVYAMGEATLENTEDPQGLRQRVGGVIYKTTDGGENWELFWYGGEYSSLTRYMWINPANPDVMYVSTGIFDRYAVGGPLPQIFSWEGGLGVLKTTDGGKTWRTLGVENGLRMLYIGSLYMHPENPDILLAAAGHLIDGSVIDEWAGTGEPISAGIYRTTDGGEHWTQTLIPDSWETFTAVELCESDPNIGYAGSETAIYLTQDSGQTWLLVSGEDRMWGPPGVEAGWPIDLQCDPRDPARIFANNYNGGNFLSEDYGYTWVNASDGYSGAIVFRVAVDSTNPARVYAAGRSGIWRSDDGGGHWTGVYFPPTGNDESGFKIEDGGARGIEWTFVAVDPSQPDHILGGHVPLLESSDGGFSWQLNLPSEELSNSVTISAAVFAPSNPLVVYIGLAGDGCIRFHENAPCNSGDGVAISQDGGTTWQDISGSVLEGVAVFDLDVDPDSPQVVYAAAETGLYRTTDGGSTWTLMQGLPEGIRVRTVAVDPSNGQHILTAVDQRGVFSSSNGGQTWAENISGLEANNSIHDIEFDPADSNNVYLSDARSGVYRSDDGGATWLKMNTGLTNRYTLDLAISTDGKYLYVATHGGGVFRMFMPSQGR